MRILQAAVRAQFERRDESRRSTGCLAVSSGGVSRKPLLHHDHGEGRRADPKRMSESRQTARWLYAILSAPDAKKLGLAEKYRSRLE